MIYGKNMKQSGKNNALIKRIAKKELAVNEDNNLFNDSFSDIDVKKWILEKDKKEAGHRESLSNILKWISIAWLSYTGIIFLAQGTGWLKYDASTINTFMLSSLIEVFALWAIALKYFFHK